MQCLKNRLTNKKKPKTVKTIPSRCVKAFIKFVVKIMTQEVFCGKNILYIYFYTFNTYKNIQTQKKLSNFGSRTSPSAYIHTTIPSCWHTK